MFIRSPLKPQPSTTWYNNIFPAAVTNSLSFSHTPPVWLLTFARLAPASLPTPAPPAAVADSPPAASLLLLLSGEERFEAPLLPGLSIFDFGAPKKLVSDRCGIFRSDDNYEFVSVGKGEGVFASRYNEFALCSFRRAKTRRF